MKLLELFAGTGSISRAFAEQGWEVLSLDIDPKSGATLITDFMLWKYWEIPKGDFDAIWASPVCTMYSCARTTGKTPRDLEGSDRMVQRVLDCINYFEPMVWAFENPQTGLLKDRWPACPTRTFPTVCTGTPIESPPGSGLTVRGGSLGRCAQRRRRALWWWTAATL